MLTKLWSLKFNHFPPKCSQEVLLYPKMSPYRPDGQYPLGRLLTEPQLNSPVAPPGLLESDFRLFSWVRSQNSPGHYELSGKWGFEAVNQLLLSFRNYQFRRCFLLVSRFLTLGHNSGSGSWVTSGCLSFTSTHRVINRVHGYTSYSWSLTHPSFSTCFS